jgi:predicted Zn-dependent peptidase
MDGVINTDYTYFEFDKWIKYNDAIRKLTKEITKESFSYEKKIIKQELEDISYNLKIYEYVVRKYLDSDFFMNKYQNVLRKDVKDYHEKYYVPENMIVVDDEFNVLKQ